MKIQPYLNFNGNCREAVAFYEKVLGAKIECLIPYAGSPAAAEVPESLHDAILHARIDIEGNIVMASDAPSDQFQPAQGFSLTLQVDSTEKAEALYNGLSEGATIITPLAETFWAHRYGALVDRFGIPWSVNYAKA